MYVLGAECHNKIDQIQQIIFVHLLNKIVWCVDSHLFIQPEWWFDVKLDIIVMNATNKHVPFNGT